ncbi:MAG TPA: alpha/beta fold hydrolase [Desulfobacterales bacterium]
MNAIREREPAEGFIEIEDSRLHYLDWGGCGHPAHFLHGNGFCAGTYTPFLKFLFHELHVVASDLRGHGASTHAGGERIGHWRIFAEDVQKIIGATLPPPVVGMGHSLGAVSTYMAAALYPQLFAAVVLIDPVIFPKTMLWKIALARWLGLRRWFPPARAARRRRAQFQDKQGALQRFTNGRGIFKTWSKQFVEAYLECGLLEKDEKTAVLRCDPELEAQIFEAVPLDVWSYAVGIRCPVLVLRGEHSDAIGVESARRLERINAHFQTRTVAGTGHFLTMEKPERCAAEILDFIRKISPLSCRRTMIGG